LASGHLDQPADGATTDALLDGVRDVGLQLLPWTDTLRSLRDRAGFLHDVVGEPWPAMDDQTLLDGLESWLGPFLSGIHRRSHLTRLPLRDALHSWIGYDQVRRVDQLAPTRLSIPSGRTAAVRYDPDAGPVLSAKLQEFFGAATSPTVADGRVPVAVELLSPAGRPLAVTADLAAFWSGAYQHVRSENRGRYPKHPWPQDPVDAAPTAKTKRRLQG
ncbi:MAG: ATP-dependent helicase HrpB, partial [Nitriliruptoraceae bacterium]